MIIVPRKLPGTPLRLAYMEPLFNRPRHGIKLFVLPPIQTIEWPLTDTLFSIGTQWLVLKPPIRQTISV